MKFSIQAVMMVLMGLLMGWLAHETGNHHFFFLSGASLGAGIVMTGVDMMGLR